MARGGDMMILRRRGAAASMVVLITLTGVGAQVRASAAPLTQQNPWSGTVAGYFGHDPTRVAQTTVIVPKTRCYSDDRTLELFAGIGTTTKGAFGSLIVGFCNGRTPSDQVIVGVASAVSKSASLNVRPGQLVRLVERDQNGT